MTDCLHYSKIYSRGCFKTCPAYEAWKVRGSNPPETRNEAVSEHLFTSCETQAGLILSYPKASFQQNIPACTAAPRHIKEIGALGRRLLLRGAYDYQDVVSTGNVEEFKTRQEVMPRDGKSSDLNGRIKPRYTRHADSHQFRDGEHDLSIMDGKHGRTGRRQASVMVHAGSTPAHPILYSQKDDVQSDHIINGKVGMDAWEPKTGSNPVHPLPAMPELGAGTILKDTTIIHTPPCAHDIHHQTDYAQFIKSPLNQHGAGTFLSENYHRPLNDFNVARSYLQIIKRR